MQRKFSAYKKVKRFLDVFFALFLLITLVTPMLILFIACSIDTSSNGIFAQVRIGQFGRPFTLYKFKTIEPKSETKSFFGKFLRKYKIDELAQLYNILKGEMSFVGPRPDIPGYYDKLVRENRILLEIKPGLASEAGIKYIDEEKLLSENIDPQFYNDKVIFPDKIKMNLKYLERMSFREDVRIICLTIFSILKK